MISQVPDKITLEPALPPAAPISGVTSREGEDNVGGGFSQRMGGAGHSDGLQPSEPISDFYAAPAVR